MVIKQFGNLGIGTQTPQFPLDVTGNIRLGVGTTGNIRFGTSGVGSTQAGYIDLINNTMTVMNQQNGNIIFGTNNAEDMRILTNGNVGIGTQTPQFTLDVNGNLNVNSKIYAGLSSLAPATNDSYLLYNNTTREIYRSQFQTLTSDSPSSFNMTTGSFTNNIKILSNIPIGTWLVIWSIGYSGSANVATTIIHLQVQVGTSPPGGRATGLNAIAALVLSSPSTTYNTTFPLAVQQTGILVNTSTSNNLYLCGSVTFTGTLPSSNFDLQIVRLR